MESKKLTIKFTIYAILIIIAASMFASQRVLQNDTFYTIKVGEHIIENGITMKDPFSWHEDLIYTFPHWAYDIMIYFIYNLGGFRGIYISTIFFCTLLGLAIYFTNANLTKSKTISLIITVISISLLRNFIAARAQLLTFILFVLTIYYIEKFLETAKIRYAIPLIIIPILIANFHAAIFYFYFILYMPYLGEYGIYVLMNTNVILWETKIKKLKKKILKIEDDNKAKEEIENKIKELEEKIDKDKKRQQVNQENAYKIKITYNSNVKYLVIIMIICLFTGLLTPQSLITTPRTFEPYTHLIKLMAGDSTHNISEHLPLTLVNNVYFMVLFVAYIGILMFSDVKIRLSDLFLLGGLIFLTFYSRRQESMVLVLCAGVLIKLISYNFSKFDFDDVRMQKYMTNAWGIGITMIVISAIFAFKYLPTLKADYISKRDYPTQAAEWALGNLDLENIKIYNAYNYGSYLLFKDIPVFIDSRADLYTPQFNKDKDIFSDFLKISGVQYADMEDKLDEYGITHMFIKKDSTIYKYISRNMDKYEKLYSDDYFAIYQRK